MTMVLGTSMWNRSHLTCIIMLINIQLWAQDSSFTFNQNDYV